MDSLLTYLFLYTQVFISRPGMLAVPVSEEVSPNSLLHISMTELPQVRTVYQCTSRGVVLIFLNKHKKLSDLQLLPRISTCLPARADLHGPLASTPHLWRLACVSCER